MRTTKKSAYLLLAVLLAVPAMASAAARRSETVSLCLAAPTGGGSFNTFIFQDVPPLAPAKVIPLHGMYFSGARNPSPLSGSALMTSDGTVRIGMFVHSSATTSSTFVANDFTLSATTDATFAGTYQFDNDGDYRPNGTLAIEPVDCATIVIP